MGIWDANKHATKMEILEGFSLTDGNVMQTAELLGVAPQTIYNHLGADLDLQEKLYAIRKGKYIRRLDLSESVIDRIHQMVEEKTGYALQAAKYYLDTHGKKRGYSPVKEETTTDSPNDSKIEAFTDNMILKDEIATLKEQLLAYKSQTRQEPEGSDSQI